MTIRSSAANTWLIVEANNQQFAIPATFVGEIVPIPEITSVPLRRPQDRGVMNLRGRVIPLIDLRKQFGWLSVPEETEAFQQLMQQREQDHRNWLRELDKSVTEGTEFRLATDPHKCAFGKWYYAYHSDSPWVSALLRKFEPPHNKIHALASSIEQLKASGHLQEARDRIEHARQGTLLEMVSLFDQLKSLVREEARELAVVITAPSRVFAISTDKALAVETIPPEMIKELEIGAALLGTAGIHRVAERPGAKSIAMVLEPEALNAAFAA